MKKIILVLLGMFFLVSAYAVDWNAINDREAYPITEITNVEKDLNYEPGGCIFVYRLGTVDQEWIDIRMFSSPSVHYVEYKDWEHRKIERWYGSYKDCKSFIWKLTKNQKLNEADWQNWQNVE